MLAISAIVFSARRASDGLSDISRSLSRPANRDPVHPQGRLADADGHALAVLAAGADAGVEFKIVADHADAMQVARAVADQHRPLDRRADLAVLEPVGL